MCCYEMIVNQIIKETVKAMHDSAAQNEREWVRENVLDADLTTDGKAVVFEVTNFEAQQRLERGDIANVFVGAVKRNYYYRDIKIVVKQPLDLTAINQKQAVVE